MDRAWQPLPCLDTLRPRRDCRCDADSLDAPCPPLDCRRGACHRLRFRGSLWRITQLKLILRDDLTITHQDDPGVVGRRLLVGDRLGGFGSDRRHVDEPFQLRRRANTGRVLLRKLRQPERSDRVRAGLPGCINSGCGLAWSDSRRLERSIRRLQREGREGHRRQGVRVHSHELGGRRDGDLCLQGQRRFDDHRQPVDGLGQGRSPGPNGGEPLLVFQPAMSLTSTNWTRTPPSMDRNATICARMAESREAGRTVRNANSEWVIASKCGSLNCGLHPAALRSRRWHAWPQFSVTRPTLLWLSATPCA